MITNLEVLHVVHYEIFRSLLVGFTVAFELPREQFRAIVLHDWKSDSNYTESHAHLVAA